MIKKSIRVIQKLQFLNNFLRKSIVLLIRVEGFNTQELATRGSFRALKKCIKPRIQIPYKNNIPRPFRAGLLILIFANSGYAFTQVKFNVYLNEYAVNPQNSVFAKETERITNVFFNKLRELDMGNGYLNIVPVYLIPGKIPETDYSESDYIINGKITQYKDDMYNIDTLLIRNEMPVFPKNNNREYVDLLKLQDIISNHAEEVYKQFEYFVTGEKKGGDIRQLLIDFDNEYMQKIGSMDIDEAVPAIQRLAMLENTFGESTEISSRLKKILNSSIDVSLSRAEESISYASRRRISNETMVNLYKLSETHVSRIRQVIRYSEDPRFFTRLEDVEKKLENIEKKIDKQWEKENPTVNTGGLELFIDKPFYLMLDPPEGFDIQEAYPDILGVSLRFLLSTDYFLQWYINFSYAGINGSMKENKVAYLQDAEIHLFSLSAGVNFQPIFNKIIAPYLYLGIGYMHSIEYASDGKDSVSLNTPGFILDAGIGNRFYFNKYFALNAMVQGHLIASDSILMDVKLSLGLSYLFYGEQYIGK